MVVGAIFSGKGLLGAAETVPNRVPFALTFAIACGDKFHRPKGTGRPLLIICISHARLKRSLQLNPRGDGVVEEKGKLN